MTLVAAYIYNDTVHIVADSALTSLRPNNDRDPKTDVDFSSFGELLHKEIKNSDTVETVEEGFQKIFSLDSKIVAAFSGEVYEGQRVIDDLINEFKLKQPEKTSTVLIEYFRVRKPTDTDYFIGYFENSKPCIFYYDNENSYGHIDVPFGVFCGSGIQILEIREPINDWIAAAKRANSLNAHEVLIGAIATAQSASLNSPSFKNGVGGFFNGAFLDRNGIQWAKDSSFFLYSAKHFKPNLSFVTKFNRDNATFVYSSHQSLWSVYFSHNLKIPLVEWKAKWIEQLLQLNKNCKTNYYHFLSYDRKVVVVLDANASDFNNYVVFDNFLHTDEGIGSTKFSIQLLPPILDKMLDTSYVDIASEKVMVRFIV